jgi:hypothetical protein
LLEGRESERGPASKNKRNKSEGKNGVQDDEADDDKDKNNKKKKKQEESQSWKTMPI